MRILDRLRTGKHVRTLRAGDAAPPTARLEAQDALAALGAAAIEPLLPCLATPGRDAALEILGRVLDAGTLPAFVKALGSTDRHVSAGVRTVLEQGRRYDPHDLIAYLAGSEVPNARLEPVLSARAGDLDGARLLQILPDLAREGRSVLHRLLEQIADARIAGPAIRLLKDDDWWIRLHMTKLLERIGGEEAEAALASILTDGNRNVRLQAVHSLHAMRSRTAIPFLANSLRDGDLTVQAAAIDALIAIGDPSAVPHLVDVLKDDSEQCRRGAVEVLNEVATTEAIQDLVHALRDADWWVRVRSADALGTIGGPKVVDAILCLVGDEDVHIRRYAVEILNTVADERSVEKLVIALDDEDWWVRERSIDALGHAADRRATAPLLALLERDPDVAPLCARALAAVGDPAAVPGLLDALEAGPGAELRGELVTALKTLNAGDLAAFDRQRLENALKHEGVRVEKTRLRPMEVKTATHASAGSASGGSLPPATAVRTPTPASAGRAAEGAPPPRRAPRADEIRPGDVLLDRYRVVRCIGTGGFSTVFLVEDTVVDETMILKILSPHLTLEESSLARFVQELRLSRRVAHPNVIRIHDLLELGEARGISMEYFAGADLGQVLDKCHRLPPDRAVKITRQIAAGLGAAHEQGIIHRDVKPANVLIGEDDQVKIVDFGLAAASREAENRLTRTGHLVGTPHYMAPELIRGEDIDGRADLYSLGVMMYEMLFGALPYDGDNPMNVLFRHLDADAPPLSKIMEIPAELSGVVERLMAPDPAARTASAEALADELDALPRTEA